MHRKLFSVLLSFLLCGPVIAWAAPVNTVALEIETDFRKLGYQVEHQQLPLLLVITRDGCGYCAVLRDKVLLPMLRSGKQQVIIRELNMDDSRIYRDFDGRQTSAAALAGNWGAELTPTVLLLDASGRILAEKLVGINNIDMYPYYLDREINRASASIRAGTGGSTTNP